MKSFLINGFCFTLLLITTAFLSPISAQSFSTETVITAPQEIVFKTADNVSISGKIFENSNSSAIIFCHRLLGSNSNEVIQKLHKWFSDEYDLITFNFRGHSSSGFTSSYGGDEILDLRAVMSFSITSGYKKIIVMGVGMGSVVAIRSSALFRNIDGLIMISPSGLSPAFQPKIMKILSAVTLDSDFGRVPVRILTKTRLGSRYSSRYPIDLIDEVPDIPICIIQARNDRHVRFDNIRSAFGNILTQNDIIPFPGELHADKLLVDETLSEIRRWLNETYSDDSTKHQIESTSSKPDINPITLTGDMPIPKEVILREFDMRTVSASNNDKSFSLNSENVSQEIQDIISFYGYTKSTIIFNSASNLYDISIPKINTVEIRNNKWVTEEFIKEQIKINSDFYNVYELDKSLRRLSATPSISTVKSETIMIDNGNIDILLTITENRPYGIGLSTKFTDIDQFYGVGFTWNKDNDTGLKFDANLMAGIANRDLLASLGTTKYLWDKNLTLGGAVYKTIKSRDDLDYIYTRQEVLETGGNLFIGYNISSNIHIDLGLFTKEFTSPADMTDYPIEEGVAQGGYLKLNLGGRLPLQGFPLFNWKHTFYYQNSGIGQKGDFNYSVYQLNFSGDIKLWEDHNSVSTAHYGWIKGEAPPQEYFSLGGMTTLPGYIDDSFIDTRMFRFSQKFYLNLAKWIADRSAFSPIRIITSFHAGTVWGEGDELILSDLKRDMGIEFEYMKILRLGVTFPLEPYSSSPFIYFGWSAHVLR